MKKIFISLVVAVLFIACGDSKDDKKVLESVKKEEVGAKSEQDKTSTPKITVTENSTNIEKENPFISYDLDGNRVVRVSPDGSETPLTKELGALISIKNNYEKLQLYRIIMTSNNSKGEIKNNEIIEKFVDETYHIENDYLFQLNPQEFDMIPDYIVNMCNETIEKLKKCPQHFPQKN